MSDDVVNHPSHYNQYKGFEVIDVCKQLRSPDGGGNYLRGNAFKYLARAGWKDKGNTKKEIEDLRKCLTYIQFEIDRLQGDVWDEPEEEKPAPGTYFGAPIKERCWICQLDMVENPRIQDIVVCPAYHGYYNWYSNFYNFEGVMNTNNNELVKWFAKELVSRMHCPTCASSLTRDTTTLPGDAYLVCPHGHGTVDWRDPSKTWNPVQKKPFEGVDDSTCPVCSAILQASAARGSGHFYCPNNHGVYNSITGQKYFPQPDKPKPVSTWLYACRKTECKYKVITATKQSGTLYCKDGHGSLMELAPKE